MEVESKGNCDARGGSGEVGCLQFLPSTWRMWAVEVLGYVPPMTQTNELYVATSMIQKWINQGYNNEQIATIWNSGGIVHKSGINSHGIAYNTRSYAQAVLKHIDS